MRTVSPLYKKLRGQTGSQYEVQIVRGSVTYGMRKIKSLRIHQSLLKGDAGPSIGGTTSAQCSLTIVETSDNWPRMASFEVKVRLVSEDRSEEGEWLSFGTFWTDTRTENKYGDLTVEAFDGMLRLQQYWTDLVQEEHMPASWPITAATAAPLLAEATGIELDSRDTLDNTVAFIGLDTMATARDVWSDIAAAHGRNAVITPEGKIHLLPLVNWDSGKTSGIAGIAVAGLAVVGTSTGGSGSTSPDYAYIGLVARRIDTSPDLPAISGIELSNEEGRKASAGSDSGYVLKAKCNFSDSAVATLCMTETQGYTYRPFTATDTDLDPATELGDLVVVDGRSHQIMSIDWTVGAWISADVSAPAEYEIDHEYTVLDEAAVTLRKALAADSALDTALRSYIQQTATSITQGIAMQYVSDSDMHDVLNQLQLDITGAIQLFTGSAVPTLENYPASEWTTAEDKGTHIGDLYLVEDTGGDHDGEYYRFERNNRVYSWELLNENEVEGALTHMALANQAAAEATATANVVRQMVEDNYSPTEDIESRFETKGDAESKAFALQSEVDLTNNSLTIAMTEVREDVAGQFSDMAYYIRYVNGVVIIGRTDEPTSFQISNSQMAACYGGEITSFWNQDKQRTPKQLEIPVGGSLRLGDILWQPRSSGNLSLMWVGETEDENAGGE